VVRTSTSDAAGLWEEVPLLTLKALFPPSSFVSSILKSVTFLFSYSEYTFQCIYTVGRQHRFVSSSLRARRILPLSQSLSSLGVFPQTFEHWICTADLPFLSIPPAPPFPSTRTHFVPVRQPG